MFKSITLLAFFLAIPSQASISYTQAFPHFIQYCAATQIKPMNDERGGYGGHAVIYVEGLCKNENVSFPQVKLCSEILKTAKHQHTPHTGVGISVDKYFKNVNWVAVPGYDLFINGNLSRQEILKQNHIQKMMDKAVDAQIFEGVIYDEKQIDPRLLKTYPQGYYGEMARQAIGTDLAIDWGRSLECIRLPIKETQLVLIQDYLNRLNEKYYHGSKPFEWSAYYNNCTHTSANAFAELGVRKRINADDNMFFQALSLAIPANALMTLEYKTQKELPHYDELALSPTSLQQLQDYEWLPARHGALTVLHPVHRRNEVFNTELGAMKLPPKPLYNSYAIWSHYQDSKKKVFTDLESNLKLWKKRYEDELQKIFAISMLNDKKAINYIAYLQDQLNEVNRLLGVSSSTK